ncbi:RmlC-like cupin domain-containing protein [Hyaloraphidium curvatum]|nr:RmlC-like cupin domain-containing protein [Hyaloraphidium curvatum]
MPPATEGKGSGSTAADPSKPPAVFVATKDLALESTLDFGNLQWKTIFGGEGGPSTGFTQGIVCVRPKTEVRRHHHEQPETCFVLSGSALVSTGYDGQYEAPRRVEAGDAVFYPSNCSHQTYNDTDEDFVVLYTFPAAAKFSDVVYCYE